MKLGSSNPHVRQILRIKRPFDRVIAALGRHIGDSDRIPARVGEPTEQLLRFRHDADIQGATRWPEKGLHAGLHQS